MKTAEGTGRASELFKKGNKIIGIVAYSGWRAW
jgi:hypothetical protein